LKNRGYDDERIFPLDDASEIGLYVERVVVAATVADA